VSSISKTAKPCASRFDGVNPTSSGEKKNLLPFLFRILFLFVVGSMNCDGSQSSSLDGRLYVPSGRIGVLERVSTGLAAPCRLVCDLFLLSAKGFFD